MVINMEQYVTLRREFLSAAKFHIKSGGLKNLKIQYRDAINSVRRLDHIDDIEDLIKILEKRAVICYNNIIPLRHIARLYLPHSEINWKIDQYEAWVKNCDPDFLAQHTQYRHQKGKWYLPWTTSNINNLSPTLNLNNQSHDNHSDPHNRAGYKISACQIHPNTINHELSDCNLNSEIDLSLQRDPLDTHNSYIANANDVNDHNKLCNDLELHKTCYHLANKEGNLIPNIANLPISFSSSILESPPVMATENNASLQDWINTSAVVKTPLLSTPHLFDLQTVNSSEIDKTSLHHTLTQSVSNYHVDTEDKNVMQSVKKKHVFLCLMILPIAITLTIVLTICGFLKTTVPCEPEPSAPSIQATHYPARTSNPYIDCNLEWNQGSSSGAQPVTENPGLQIFQQAYPAYNTATQLVKPAPHLKTLPTQEEKIQNMVFDRVSDRLGRTWQKVARHLDIRESEIDNIERQYHYNLKEQAYAALKIFAAESDLNHWQKNLMAALEHARRKDLKEYVEELLSRQY